MDTAVNEISPREFGELRAGNDIIFTPGMISLAYTTMNHSIPVSHRANKNNENVNESFSVVDKSGNLSSVLKAAAGYYVDRQKSIALNLTKTIIVTIGSIDYMNHINNFKCFTDRLGLKVFFGAYDLATSENLKKRGFYAHYLDDLSYQSQSAKGRDFQFRQKFLIVLAALERGYSTIFSDTDIIWRVDPIHKLVYKNIDFLYSLDVVCPM